MPSVEITSRSLWRIRLARELARYVFYAVAISGLLASARFALDPPHPVVAHRPLLEPVPRDLEAEGFASLFARRYLTWDSQDPEAHQRGMASFVGSAMDSDAGLRPPPSGEQQVQWVEIVQERDPRQGRHLYTVAVQTDTAGLLYLTVGVLRDADGSLALAQYPAFVGAPASRPAALPSSEVGSESQLRELDDAALRTVIDRALRNYLAGSASDLAADLSSTAHVSLPGSRLALRAVQSLRWSPRRDSVRAVLQAQDQRGAQYTLDYELDVARRGGRWDVSAIQMNPNR